MYYFMLFCSINSESSELTLKSPKKVHFKYLDDALKEKNKVWNVGHFMHSTVAALNYAGQVAVRLHCFMTK